MWASNFVMILRRRKLTWWAIFILPAIPQTAPKKNQGCRCVAYAGSFLLCSLNFCSYAVFRRCAWEFKFLIHIKSPLTLLQSLWEFPLPKHCSPAADGGVRSLPWIQSDEGCLPRDHLWIPWSCHRISPPFLLLYHKTAITARNIWLNINMPAH